MDVNVKMKLMHVLEIHVLIKENVKWWITADSSKFINRISDFPVESRMIIGQLPPFNNQWMGKVEFWLAYSQRIT